MGIEERRDRERQAITDSILDAARELFLAEGYPSVSIRKIAERIEYSPAAIYSYYPSKDDIFLALAKEGFHRLDFGQRQSRMTDKIDVVTSEAAACSAQRNQQHSYTTGMHSQKRIAY